jgi:hypothetical protein
MSPTLYDLYINYTTQTSGINLALFADDTCLYATDRKEGYVQRKTQSGLDSMAAWCKRCNIKINEDKTRAIYFTHRNRPPDSLLMLNGRSFPCVNRVKYLGVIFDKKMGWRLHIQMIEAKAFRTFVRIYSLLKSERLSSNINSILHKALVRSVMTYACSAWEFTAESHPLKLQRLQNRVLRITGNFPRRTSVRDMLSKFCKFMIS